MLFEKDREVKRLPKRRKGASRQKRTRVADGIAQDGNVSRPQVPDLNASGIVWALEQVANDYTSIAHERCAALGHVNVVSCATASKPSRAQTPGAQATQVDWLPVF